mgnify:CR=1 FL=1
MSCSCIKNTNYNFYLDNINCKTLVYKDTSEWVSIPDTHEIKVIVPGSSVEHPLTVTGSILFIQPEDIGLPANVNLPDGIYTFVLEICDKKFIKKEVVLCKLKCKIYNYLASSYLTCKDDRDKKILLDKLNEYRLLYEAIIANAKCCKWNKAKELLEYLNKKLYNYNENCNCL